MKLNKDKLLLISINLVLICVMSALVVKTGIALGGNSSDLYTRISAWLTAMAIEFTVTSLVFVIGQNKRHDSVIWKMIIVIGMVSIYYNMEYNILNLKNEKITSINNQSYIDEINSTDFDISEANTTVGVNYRTNRVNSTLDAKKKKIDYLKSIQNQARSKIVSVEDFKDMNWLDWIRVFLTSSVLFSISIFLTFVRQILVSKKVAEKEADKPIDIETPKKETIHTYVEPIVKQEQIVEPIQPKVEKTQKQPDIVTVKNNRVKLPTDDLSMPKIWFGLNDKFIKRINQHAALGQLFLFA